MQGKSSLGWGLIGASTIAKEHMIAAINAQSDSRVVAVMSSDADRAGRFATQNNIPHSYHALDDLLADPNVDVVYISTTNDLHLAQTVAAAQAGKHVLCEKPLALSLADALAMVEACQKAGVVMGTNHHLRNAVTHRMMRKLIADGAIGKVLTARVFHAVYLPTNLQGWRINQPGAGAGVVLDITVHDTDTLRFVLNDDVDSVIAQMAQHGLASGSIEDTVMGVMTMKNGVLAQFHDAFTVKHAKTGFQVLGTEGSLLGEDVMTQQPRGHVLLRRHNLIEEVDLGLPENLYIRAVRHFNDAVRGNGQPAATAEDGVKSLATALAVLEAARTGCKTTVQYR